MVWRSFKKNNKKSVSGAKKVIPAMVKKEVKKTWKSLLVDKLLKRSGMWHGIDDITGKKIKDAFVDRELKKIYFVSLKSKRSLRKRVRLHGFSIFNRRKLDTIKDGYRLASCSVDKKNLFSISSIKKLKSKKYIPSVYNNKWMAMHIGTMVDKRQESYLQSKKDIRWTAFKKKLKNFDDSVAEVTNKIIWLNIFSEKMLLADGDHDSEHYNNFIRYYSYKTLLFKSFWFSKLISTIIRCGKKVRVLNYMLRGFSYLKTEFGRSPTVLLFEILEMYRMPIRGLVPKSTTRKSVIRTHLVPWWKQYTQTLIWIRHSISGGVKARESWNNRIRVELFNLMSENVNCLVKKRIESNFQLIAFGRVAIHFRWYKRYSKRTVKSIRILDRKLYQQ